MTNEETLDGLYIIRTSLPKEELSAEEAVNTYKEFSNVEWAFRTLKTTRLEHCPIYHWTEGRIKSHVFLCMLSYYVEWHLQQRLRPILYADDKKEEGSKKRASPVAPAQKSDKALTKEATHSTEKGFTVHNMKTALDFLGTICKHEIQYENHGEQFYVTTEPTPYQKKILELAGVSL